MEKQEIAGMGGMDPRGWGGARPRAQGGGVAPARAPAQRRSNHPQHNVRCWYGVAMQLLLHTFSAFWL